MKRTKGKEKKKRKKKKSQEKKEKEKRKEKKSKAKANNFFLYFCVSISKSKFPVIEDVKCPPGRTDNCVHFGVSYCDVAPPCYRAGKKRGEEGGGEGGGGGTGGRGIVKWKGRKVNTCIIRAKQKLQL